MAGGLIAGLRHEEAVRSPSCSPPPSSWPRGSSRSRRSAAPPTSGPCSWRVAAGLTAYASARFLVRYFRVGRLDPYAYYCAGLGVLGLILLR